MREGLRHGHWQVRKWCAAFLDHHADPETIPELLPLLHDPKSDVRLWAVHSLSCDRCKVDENPIDFVPHLVERIERDESIRVRRMAVLMLTIQPDVRCGEAVRAASSRRRPIVKLRKHAEWGSEAVPRGRAGAGSIDRPIHFCEVADLRQTPSSRFVWRVR